MISSFKHKGLKRFFLRGDGSKLNPEHLDRIGDILSTLNAAVKIEDIDLATYNLHELKGDRKGVWSVTVRSNWRITFTFENGDANDVGYEDYH